MPAARANMGPLPPGNPVNGKTAELTAPAPGGGTSSLSLLGAYTDSEDSS